MTQDLISKGRHRALVRISPEAIQFGTTGEGANEKEQVVVLFDFTDQNDPDYGRSISAFMFFTEKTTDRTIESLRHCGWVGDELADLPDIAARGELNQEVELVVDHEEYNGEWQAKVRWVNKPGGGSVKLKKPLEGRDLASFSARMKSRLRSSAPVGSKPANGAGAGYRSSSPHPNAPGADDDIPF